MNELRIHTIADLQLHVCHCGKVFLALTLALDLDLALALTMAQALDLAFLMNEAEKLTKVSVHEDDLYIVHDALVLMAAKETINGMKKKGTYIIGCYPLMDCRMVLLMPAVLLVIAPNSCH